MSYGTQTGKRKGTILQSVYIVHSEYGVYSDLSYAIEGVFSTYDGARKYVESKTMVAFRHAGKVKRDGWCRDVDVWSNGKRYLGESWEDTTEVAMIDEREISPRTTDGKTFMFEYPDGEYVDCLDAETYFVAEYEVDELCHAT